MIDSHCHLNDERFQADLEEVLNRAGASGVRHAVVIGYDIPSSEKAVALAKQHGPSLSAVVGLSTHEAASWSEETGIRIRKLLAEEGVVGLGETGLDYHYPTPAREDQVRSLVAQLCIANETNSPVVFHLREASEDFFKILDQSGFEGHGVLHCFAGDEESMRIGVERGLFVSFSGILTFKKSLELREVAKKTPLENLLIETDAPYLAPVPHRGKRCEPAHVIETAKMVSSLKGISYDELENRMEENLTRLFPQLSLRASV